MESTKLPPAYLSTSIEPRAPGHPIPLTALQHRLWRTLAKEGQPISQRMCASAVRVFGRFDPHLFQKSIEAVLQRHESLRIRFEFTDEGPSQRVHPNCEYDFEMVNLSELSPAERERSVRRLTQEFLDGKLDVTVSPMFEAKLWRLSDQEHVAVLALDHLVSDDISNNILTRDVWESYKRAAHGLPVALPALPVQFADYAVWQRRTYDDWMRKHAGYWRERLINAPRTQLPPDIESASVAHPMDSTVHMPFGKQLSGALREVARREGTLLPLVVFAVYVVVMSHWLNQSELIILFVSHGRHQRPEFENMIGLLTTNLFVRIDCHKNDTLLDLLKRVDLEFHRTLEHHDFDRVPDFIPECATDLTFNWRSSSWTRRTRTTPEKHASDLRTQPFMARAPYWSSKFWALFYDAPGGICVTVRYRPDLLPTSTIEWFGRSLQAVAQSVCQHPLSSIGSLPLT